MNSIKPVHLSDSRLQPAFLGAAVIAVLSSVSPQGDVSIPIPSSRQAQILLYDLRQLKLLAWANPQLKLQSTFTCIPKSKPQGWRTRTGAATLPPTQLILNRMSVHAEDEKLTLSASKGGAKQGRAGILAATFTYAVQTLTQSCSSELLYDL